jgi:pimeloyl-ACP methyl ester carboxylesterase
VDSVAFDNWPTLEARIARAVLPLLRLLPANVLLRVLRRDLKRGYADATHSDHSIDLYLRPFAAPDGRRALAAHIAALTNRETRKLARQLAKIRVPTAIIWGKHDRVVPLSVGEGLHAGIAGSSLHVLPDGRHFTPEEMPREIADIIADLLKR